MVVNKPELQEGRKQQTKAEEEEDSNRANDGADQML